MRPVCCNLAWKKTPFASLPSKPGRGDGRPKPLLALPSLARMSEASSVPGLSLRPRVRPTFTSPGQGSALVSAISPVRPGPGRLSPPVHSGPWTPASGDGRGPHRPPPRQQGTPKEPEPHPRRRLRTYLQGTARLLDSGRGPEDRRRGGPEPVPPDPLASLGVRDGAGRGHTPGDLWPASAARRGVPRTWLSPQHQAIAAAAILPSTPCRRRRCRRRRPPRVSRMWAFPGVACAGAEDWGLQAAPLGPGASTRLVASRPTLARPLLRAGVIVVQRASLYHHFLAPHRDMAPGATRRAWVASGKGGERRSETADVMRQDV